MFNVGGWVDRQIPLTLLVKYPGKSGLAFVHDDLLFAFLPIEFIASR